MILGAEGLSLITLLGFDYRPQLADLPDAKLWRIAIGADYGPLNAAARGKIDPARIERQWPDILRVGASIHTGAVPAIGPRESAGNRLFPARSRRIWLICFRPAGVLDVPRYPDCCGDVHVAH